MVVWYILITIMDIKAEFITSGCVTTPMGFRAGAASAGIKSDENALDLGVIFSEMPCVADAVFTKNRIKATPVIVSQGKLPSEKIRAIVVNSGCANACTGEQGMADAIQMVNLTAKGIGAAPEDILVASTGVIGVQMPMEKVEKGLQDIVLTPDGGHDFTRAIMTTDTVAKEAAIRVKTDECEFTIGGTVKGSGMIHPDLATMLGFLTTDAAIDINCLQSALRDAVDNSFNMISIDGDTSTNDMVLIMANGKAGNGIITEGSTSAGIFRSALNEICIYLAKQIVRDGEGANKLFQVTVEGAASLDDARCVARTIVSSPLVKSAVYGCDPNWGRIVAAAGRSGVEVVEEKIDLYIDNLCVLKSGVPQSFNEKEAALLLGSEEVPILLKLNIGSDSATAWGCDLSEEYVRINSEYTT